LGVAGSDADVLEVVRRFEAVVRKESV
jgi:hypothetical protein